MKKENLKKYQLIKLTLYNFIKIAIANKWIKVTHSIIPTFKTKTFFIVIESITILGDDIEIKRIETNDGLEVAHEKRMDVWKKAIKDCKTFLNDINALETPSTTELIMDIMNTLIVKDNRIPFKFQRTIDLLFTRIRIDLVNEIDKFNADREENIK